MASLGMRFNATEHDTTQTEYSELPDGIYRIEIEAAEVKETSAGDGKLLKVTNAVIEPEEYAGRKLFNNYNLENKSADAQRIGLEQFASLCRAIEVVEVDDTDVLLLKPYTVTVKLGRPSKDGKYPARAEIKRYWFPDEGNIPTPEIAAVQPSTKTAPANQNRPAPANQNRPAASRPASSPTAAGKKRPWG